MRSIVGRARHVLARGSPAGSFPSAVVLVVLTGAGNPGGHERLGRFGRKRRNGNGNSRTRRSRTRKPRPRNGHCRGVLQEFGIRRPLRNDLSRKQQQQQQQQQRPHRAPSRAAAGLCRPVPGTSQETGKHAGQSPPRKVAVVVSDAPPGQHAKLQRTGRSVAPAAVSRREWGRNRNRNNAVSKRKRKRKRKRQSVVVVVVVVVNGAATESAE